MAADTSSAGPVHQGEQPTVDVIISTNRESPFLSEAVESVRAQSWTNWRLILVDDGSATPDFAQSAVAHVPGALVVRQDPRGLPAARNTGVKHGRGALITFLDDDDVWHPRRLETQVAAWVEASHHVAVYCAGWYMDADGARFGTGWSATQTRSVRFLSGEVPPPRIVTLMVRRDVCESMGGFNESFSLAEDNEFILRLAQHGEMLAVPDELVGYRRHGFNMSGAVPLEGRRANERVLTLHIEAADHRGDSTTARLLRKHLRRLRRLSADECVRVMAAAVRRHEWRPFLAELSWAVRRAPWWTVRRVVVKTLESRREAR